MLNIPQNEILYLQFGLQCCWLTAAPMLPGHKLRVAWSCIAASGLGYKAPLVVFMQLHSAIIVIANGV